MADVNFHRSVFGGKRIFKSPRLSVAFNATETTKTVSLAGNGVLHSMILELPNFTNVVTTVISITNSDGVEVYASSALARNAVHKITAQSNAVALEGECSALLTLSGAAGGEGGTARLTFNLE